MTMVLSHCTSSASYLSISFRVLIWKTVWRTLVWLLYFQFAWRLHCTFCSKRKCSKNVENNPLALHARWIVTTSCISTWRQEQTASTVSLHRHSFLNSGNALGFYSIRLQTFYWYFSVQRENKMRKIHFYDKTTVALVIAVFQLF